MKLTQSQWIGVAVVVVVILGLVLFTTMFSTGPEIQNVTNDITMQQDTMGNDEVPAGVGALKIQEVTLGTGAVAVAGKVVSVHYTGRFENGTVFDSSVNRGQPIQFPLGAGNVIAGWDEGIAGMKVGGKRVLTIPSNLAYGPEDLRDPGTGAVVIPGGSTLIFDVELVAVQ